MRLIGRIVKIINLPSGTRGAYAIRPYLTNRIGLFWFKKRFYPFGISLFWIKNGFLPLCESLFRIKKWIPPFCTSLSWIKRRVPSFRISLSWIEKRFPLFGIDPVRIENRFIPFCRILFWIKERDKRFCECPTLTLKRDVQNGEGILWTPITKKHSSYLVARLKQLRDISSD